MSIKRKIIILIAVFAGIFALISYFIIYPTVADIKKISHSVYLERVDLEKKYLRGQLLRKALDDFERIKKDRDKFTVIFLKEGDELGFVTALEKIAADNHLGQEIKFLGKKPAKDNAYTILSLEININAKFTDILKYLDEIEALDYYFNIYSVSLDSANVKNTSENGAAGIIKGEIFLLPKEQKSI